MRIAIISDIHGNLTALEAVLADLQLTAPDLILHGGDLPHGGSHPAEVVDRIRELGWQGVLGNTDEMLFKPESLTEFASRSPHLQAIWTATEEMAEATREALGQERLDWLRGLPRAWLEGPMALVHASPETTWKAPGREAADDEMLAVYGSLGKPMAVYGHIHTPFIRSVPGMTVVNTGSVSLSYDGDRRASYLLVDDGVPSIRRVEYDVDQEITALFDCGYPHAEWVAKMLASGTPQMP